jgi:hypothetical protein
MNYSLEFLFLLPTIDPIYLANKKKRHCDNTQRKKMRAHLSQSEELILFCREKRKKYPSRDHGEECGRKMANFPLAHDAS